MITMSGWTRFATEEDSNGIKYVVGGRPVLDKYGGAEKVAYTQEGRNWWAIMKTFNLLPGDPRLQNLDIDQYNFIIGSINADVMESEGKNISNMYSDDDTSWYTADEDDFDVVPKELKEEDIVRQVREKVGLEEIERMEQKFKQVVSYRQQMHSTKVAQAEKDIENDYTDLQERARNNKEDRSHELDKYFDEVELDEDYPEL